MDPLWLLRGGEGQPGLDPAMPGEVGWPGPNPAGPGTWEEVCGLFPIQLWGFGIQHWVEGVVVFIAAAPPLTHFSTLRPRCCDSKGWIYLMGWR